VLHEFIKSNNDELIARARAKVATRPWPTPSTVELQNGVPLFLVQLSETLRLELSKTPFPGRAIKEAAVQRASDLQEKGFTVDQVVHDYGDICQAITELAIEKHAAITNEEFHILNRSLDNAIADAVTEFGRKHDQDISSNEVERLGRLAHELRNLLSTAVLSFQMIRSGRVGAGGSTGTVLGRSLMGLRDLIDTTLSEVRVGAGAIHPSDLLVAKFLDQIRQTASIQAQFREVTFVLEPVDGELTVHADPQLLSSAILNLLQNAFKYTVTHGSVVLRANSTGGRVTIEVEDECGGLAEGNAENLFSAFGERRGKDRTGLGLGLSISRKAVRANAGEIYARNLPGKGCIFSIDLPRMLH
jgi:signal transduction histidine kinase